MLLINLGILVGVYTIDKLLKSHRKKLSTKLITLEKSEREKIEKKVIPIPNNEFNKHYTKLSGASILIVAGSHFVFPALTLINVILISYIALPAIKAATKDWKEDKKIKNPGYTSIVNVIMLMTNNYFAASIQNLTYYVSEYLIEESRKKSISLTNEAYYSVPEKVWLINGDIEQEILLSQLKQGDVVVVKTGQVIPIDADIVSGIGLVDQQTLTGESCPIEKIVGDAVMASTILIDGHINICVNDESKNSHIERLNRLLENNQNCKSGLQLKGEAWANTMAMPVVALSAVSVPLIGIDSASALLFSLPANTVRSMLSMQTVQRMEAIARQHIAIKDGRVLEELAQIDTILFDKTGTLTHTKPIIKTIVTCGQYDETRLLCLAATAEQRLDHPIAQAIVNTAHAQNLVLPKVLESRYDLGLGIMIRTKEHTVHVGSQRFIQANTKIDGMATVEKLPNNIAAAMQTSKGHSFVLIAIDYRIQGLLALHPPLRSEVPEIIKALKERGFKQLSIVSGDQAKPTQYLSDHLGLDQVYSEVLPEEKAALVRKLQAQGRRVCFIGDGINDSIALKYADVSICLKSASALSRDKAQIILLDDNLQSLSNLFVQSEILQKELKQSLYFWATFGLTNTVAVPVFGLGTLHSSAYFLSAYILGLAMNKFRK